MPMVTNKLVSAIPLVLAASLSRAAVAEAPAVLSAAIATPEASWVSAWEAYRRGDFRGYIGSIAPAEHDECLCEITFLVGMASEAGMLSSAADLGELKAILRRHGAAELGPGSAGRAKDAPGLNGRKAIHAIPDKVGLYAEAMSWLRARDIAGRPPAWLSASLADLKVDGNGATASLGMFGTATFERAGEAWLLHLPAVCLKDLFRDER
jgi:hypothetical protein